MQLRTRPPDNELFDRGCDLVEAAGAIRLLARDAGSARAIPAVLGCLEASLQELAAAAAELGTSGVPASGASRREERMRRGLANLGAALADAAVAAHAARSLAARAMTKHGHD